MKAAHKGRFEEIDVLRGLAALCVMLSHYTGYCVLYFGDSPVDLSHYGFYAVELFFMISGFVIYFTLIKCETLWDFAASRVTRLYPTYWAALTLMVVIETTVFQNRIAPSSVPTATWWGGYIVNLSMLQEFAGFKNLEHVYWSLTVELGFYLGMAILFAVGLLARIEAIAAAWLAVAVLWSFIEQYLGIKVPEFVPRYLVLPFAPFFTAGIVFYRISANRLTLQRFAIILAALATEWWMNGPASLGIAIILFGIFGLTLSGQLRFLVSPITLWLGTISYPLYLIHRNLGYSTILRLHEEGTPIWIILIATIAGAVVLATLLCYGIERPASRLLRQWYLTKRPSVARRERSAGSSPVARGLQ